MSTGATKYKVLPRTLRPEPIKKSSFSNLVLEHNHSADCWVTEAVKKMLYYRYIIDVDMSISCGVLFYILDLIYLAEVSNYRHKKHIIVREEYHQLYP